MPELLAALVQMFIMLHHPDERPISTAWYGHAGKTPEALPPSTWDDSPIHDTGFHQSLERISTSAVHDTPLVPRDLNGRTMNNSHKTFGASPSAPFSEAIGCIGRNSQRGRSLQGKTYHIPLQHGREGTRTCREQVPHKHSSKRHPRGLRICRRPP